MRLDPRAIPLCAAVILTGCAQAPAPDATDRGFLGRSETGELLLVRAYRGDDDPCVLVGETEATGNFLDDAADLVGCPAGSPEAQAFPSETGAIPITEIDGYQLYTVPRR